MFPLPGNFLSTCPLLPASNHLPSCPFSLRAKVAPSRGLPLATLSKLRPVLGYVVLFLFLYNVDNNTFLFCVILICAIMQIFNLCDVYMFCYLFISLVSISLT